MKWITLIVMSRPCVLGFFRQKHFQASPNVHPLTFRKPGLFPCFRQTSLQQMTSYYPLQSSLELRWILRMHKSKHIVSSPLLHVIQYTKKKKTLVQKNSTQSEEKYTPLGSLLRFGLLCLTF